MNDPIEIGKAWLSDSSLEKWFPITAEELAQLKADNERLKQNAELAVKEVSVLENHLWELKTDLTRLKAQNEEAIDALRELVLVWSNTPLQIGSYIGPNRLDAMTKAVAIVDRHRAALASVEKEDGR